MNIATLPAKELKNRLDALILAASKDITRPILNTVKLTANGKLTLVAVDGFRLHLTEYPVKCAWQGTLLIDAKSLKAALPKAPKKADVISLDLGESFTVNGTAVPTGKKDWQYPDYTAIVPKYSAVKVKVSAVELQRIAKMQYAFCRDNDNKTRLTFHKDGRIIMSSRDPETGDVESTLTCTVIDWTAEDDALPVAVNNKYLREALDNETGDVEIEALHPARPISFTSPTMYRLIMPMNLER
jgi:DNA polymerase III sliding clamp (beta) subunit (PCNA family)